LLGYINKTGVKIWTAEDPIETPAGAASGGDQAEIGWISRASCGPSCGGPRRDHDRRNAGRETLHRHRSLADRPLVFSTLHTNSAPETVTRLLDMGLNALNFSDAFLGVLAQRLTRRLCTNCRKEYVLTKDDFDEFRMDYGEQWFGRTGMGYSESIKLYKPVGCESCSKTGYRGRMGIHELMEGTPEIKLMIKKQANTEELFKMSMQQNMSTLKQDSILKVFRGLTDISEVRRVCIQ
jgi:type II secretory ATPase GspE/PulE/Tfp pilus assembly ATPase PilB-like protein